MDHQGAHWNDVKQKGDMIHMTNSDKLEFLGQIIDIFEDFLDEKGVKIDNPDRDRDAIGDAVCSDTNIYGCDYGYLSDRIESTMTNWGFFKEES
jgi:hypothetical protein